MKLMSTAMRLKIWGAWQRSELSHLMYSRVFFNKQIRDLNLTEDELLQIDRCLAILKQKDKLLFDVLNYRFGYGEGYSKIGERINRTRQVVSRLIHEAIDKFEEVENETARKENLNNHE